MDKEEEKSMKKDMDSYYQEENERMEKEEELLKSIKKEIFPKLYKYLMEHIEEYSSSYFEIVEKPEGENQDEEGYEFWVNQTVNGGYTGDDYQGYCYFELSEKRYLKWSYDCG